MTERERFNKSFDEPFQNVVMKFQVCEKCDGIRLCSVISEDKKMTGWLCFGL